MSNNEVPVKVENGDRRYAVIATSQKWAHGQPGQIEYMKRLHAAINDEHVQNLYISFLMRRDISGWREERIPSTKAREEMQMATFEFRILEFFQGVVMYPDEKYARNWYRPNVRPHAGKKAAWFSWDRVLEAYQKFRGYNERDAEKDLKRVTERIHPKGERKTAKLVVMRQKKPRDLYSDTKSNKIRCILIDAEEVRNLTRFMLKQPEWDYQDIATTPMEDQSKPRCAFL